MEMQLNFSTNITPKETIVRLFSICLHIKSTDYRRMKEINRIEQMIAELCPNGVEFKKLGEMCYIKSGGTPNTNRSEYYNGPILWALLCVQKFKRGITEEPKKHITEYSLCQKKVSLHRITLIGLGYVTLIEGILSAISVLGPIFFDVTTIVGRIIFAFSIFSLIHSVFLTLRTVLGF